MAATVGLLLCALLISTRYYGGSIGAWAILAATGALLCAAALNLRAIAALLERAPGPAGFAIATLVVLAAAHQFSLSTETSLVPTWVLALLPIVFLVCASLPEAALEFLLRAILGIVTVVALIAAVRFFALGERATLPLIDANNFATLMYLVWIPAIHRYLVGERERGAVQHVAAALFTLTLLAALFAAQSRAGSLVVGGAALVWIVLAVLRRTSRLRCSLICAMALFAYGAVRIATTADTAAGEAGVHGALEIRAALARAGLDLFIDHPWSGVGIACFRLFYPVVRPDWEQETLGAFAHNDFIQFLAEGGVALGAALIVFAIATAVRCFGALRGTRGSAGLREAGLGLALVAVCLHATVNFVFYMAPLVLLIGIAAARTFALPSVQPTVAPRRVRAGVLGGLIFGWIAWGYLAIENVNYGVFYAEPIPGAAWIREDPHRALRYARVASALNDESALPHLGAAGIVHQLALRERDSRYLREQALTDYRRAIARDGWNPVAYVGMAAHVAAFPELVSRLGEDESEEALLLKALGVDPVNVAAVESLRAYYHRIGQPERYAALLRVVVYPRMESFKRNGEVAVARYMDELTTFAQARGDTAFLEQIESLRVRLEKVIPVRHRVWDAGVRPAR